MSTLANMTAQPADPTPDKHNDPGYDPVAIFEALPERFREDFLADYEAALDAAHDLAQFKQIHKNSVGRMARRP